MATVCEGYIAADNAVELIKAVNASKIAANDKTGKKMQQFSKKIIGKMKK
jgi:hypothetical protein